MIAYIYDESSQAARLRFEEHLSDCTRCTDEFACIADARFSVFEWHKEEFMPLATPRIVIPYATAHIAYAADNGVFAFLRGLLTVPRLATAMAVVLFAAGLGLFVSRYGDDREIAVVAPLSNTIRPASSITSGPPTDNSLVRPAAVQEAKRDSDVQDDQPQPQTDHVERATVQGRKASRPMTASIKRSPGREANPNSAKLRKAPVLNSFEESDDRSLRLSDLFDDGGAGR